MVPWLYIIGGAVLAAVGTIIATHGWNEKKLRDEAASLSVTPAFDVELTPNELVVRNTSQQSLLNVEYYIVAYKFTRDPAPSGAPPSPRHMSDRNATGGTTLAPILSPQSEVTVSGREFAQMRDSLALTAGPNELPVYAAVFVYRRERDNRRYVRIEPFFMVDINNQVKLFPLYNNSHSASSGSPFDMINMLDEIENVERKLFRADVK